MGSPFLDYLREQELGRGTFAGSTIPEMEKPVVAFGKPMMRSVEKPPVEEESPFLAHLRGLETTPPPSPPPQRGVMGDIASSLARGVAVGIPQFAGQAITGMGALTGIEPMKETGRAITGFAEELPEKIPFLQPSEAEGQGGIRRFLTGMGENLPVILAAAKTGAAIGSIVPGKGTIIGGILGGMVGIFGTFGLAGKGRAYEEALAEGLPEDQAQTYSNKIGAIEGGVWSLLAPVEAATGGIAGKFIKKPAIDTIRKLLTPTLTKSLTGMAINVPAITAAGMTSAGLQAQAAQQAGLPGPTPEEAVYDSIAPSIGISILFGLAARGMRWKDRQAIFTSLRNEAVEPQFRERASSQVFANLNKIDPEVAQMWKREADLHIQAKRPIPIDEDYMTWLSKSQRERVPAMWGTPGGGLPVPYTGEEARYMGKMAPEEPAQIPWIEPPPGVKRGEGFVMAEPWLVREGDRGYFLPGREAMKLLPGPEKAIPQLPFIEPPVGTTLGEGFRMQEPVQPKVYARVAQDAYREVIRMDENGKPILGDKTFKRSQIVPKEATVKTGKGRIAPEVGVTSAGVLPTERPSPLAPGAKITPTAREVTPPLVPTPSLPEKPALPSQAPLPQDQMDALRTQGRETGGLGIGMVQRIITNLGEKISAKKAKGALDYLEANGEIEPQVGGGPAMFPYIFTGKVPEKAPIPLREGITKYGKTYGYMKTDAGWEVYGPEGKIETAPSRDAARATIDRIKKPPAAVPPAPTPVPAPGKKIIVKGFTGKVSELSRDEFIEREMSRWGTTREEEGKRYDEIMAKGETLPVPAVGGRTEEVITPKGIKAQTRFKVVEADDLVTSIDTNFKENPNYLQELQPRDRDKVTSMNQIMRIYSKLDPEQLAESRGADTGAPIVGTDNIVESGNGRAVALKKLYADAHANAEKYRTWLNQNAERFGLTKEEVSGLKNPMLVRENATAMTPEERVAFARDANTPTTLVMSAGEKAKIDMDRLSPDVLSLFAPDESGNLMATSNREFIRSFLAKVPANEMGDFITEKEGGIGAEAKLSAQGLARIKNAIFAKAYGKENSDLITMMTEDPENNIKNVTSALLTAAPKQAMLMDAIAKGDRHDLSIAKEISNAAKTISDLRNAGTNMEEYLLQGNLFGKNLIETELVKTFNDWKQAPRKIIDTLNSYAKMVDDVGNPKQGGLFGAQKPPSKLDILEAARKVTEEKYVTPEQKGLFPPEIQPVGRERVSPPIQETPPGGIPEPEKAPGEGIPGEPTPKPAAELTKLPEADKYVNSIHNEAKKKYAKDYHEWMLKGSPEEEQPIAPEKLGAMGAQSVRLRLEDLYTKAQFQEPKAMFEEPKPITGMKLEGGVWPPSEEIWSAYEKLGQDEFIRQAGKMAYGEKGFVLAREMAEGNIPPESMQRSPKGMAPKDVNEAIFDIKIKWRDAPDVEIVPTEKDLPPGKKLYPGTKGIFGDDGKVYLVAENLKSAGEAREAIFHESVGHYGLPKMMGDSYFDLLQRVVRDFPKDIDAVGKKYKFDMDTNIGKWKAAEEKIAQVAQKGDHPGILRTLIATVKDWIRKVFPDLKVTDNDIRNLVRKASEQMKSGKISSPVDPINAKIENLRRQIGNQIGGNPKLKAGEMGRHWQNEPYFMFGDNPMTEGSWWNSIKNFKSKYDLGIKGNDLKVSERLYMLPWHIGQKFGNFRKLIDVQLNRDESREQMNHEMVQKAFADSKMEGHEFLALPKDQSKDLFRVMVWSDDQNVFFGKIGKQGEINRDVASLQTKAKEILGKELNEDQVTAYYAWKRTMDSAWAKVKKQHEVMTFAPYEDQPWYEDLKKGYTEFSKLKQRGLMFKNYILEEMSPTLFRPGGKYTDTQLKELGRAADRLEKPISRLKELRDDMGRWSYYVPRVREKGDYVIRGFDKEDKVVVSVRAIDQIRGARARDRFMKEYPGLRWEAKFEPQPIEEMYQKVSDIHLEQFIKKGIDRAKKKETITADEADHITDSLFEAVADDLKARGFASHFIMREEGATIKGYETENGQKVFYDYMTGLSGFLTKQRAAFDFFKSLEGIDPSKQPELFKEGSSYVTDMLRNSDRLDKLSGKVRGAAFTWYLSGSIKAAMVNFSQNFVTGVPFLGRVTKNPLKKYVQSMKDIAAYKFNPGHLSKEEQGFLHEMHEKGIDTAQYLREIRGRMKSQFGGTLDQIGQVLATPFSGMEVFNRESASLAMFRVMRYEKNVSYKEAFDAARDYVYNTHYLYGKSNLPAWARGGTPSSRLARTAYTFRSFNHNFLLSMMQSLKGPDGKIALDVMGRTMAYLTIFGGTAAIPFFDDLLDGMERMTGTPYKSNMRKVLKGIGGEYLSRFGMEGLPAILGADLTGSLKIGIPTVSFSDVYGVYGGMYDKGKKAIDSFQRADIYRGIESLMPAFLESPMKAYRMATEGATTPTGKTMFDEQGQPIELTPGETIAQTFGFRPERISVLGKEKRSLANVEKHYADQRDDLYAKLRMAKGENRTDVLKQIRDYNLEVQKYKGVIPPIKQEMIRNALRQKPEKKFIRFENR